MIGIYDEPFADSSNIPTYLISQMASRQFKVVLTGDGGDELMAGYRAWYRTLHQLQNPDGIKMRLKNIARKLLFQKYRSSNMSEVHVRQNDYFTKNELQAVAKNKTGYNHNKFTDQPFNSVDAAMRMDLQDYMPGDILVKTDRAAMANSLELRAPFLDVDFAEFCIALPDHFKIDKQNDKILMRESFGQLWTKSILHRHKQGFGAPVNEWLQQKGMQQLKNEYLLNSSNKMYDWLNYKACSSYTQKNNYQTWLLLTLAVWMQRNL